MSALITQAVALKHQIERMGALTKTESAAKDRDRVQVVYNARPGEGLGGAMAAAFARSGQRRNRR